MEAESITEILTNDHHFEQEGFAVLMKRNVARQAPAGEPAHATVPRGAPVHYHPAISRSVVTIFSST